MLPCSFGPQVASQVVGHQPLEGSRQVGSDDAVIVDVDLLEDPLIEVSADHRVAGSVVMFGPGQEADATVQLGLDVLGVEFGLAQVTFDAAAGQSDALLLGLEQLQRHGVLVVGLHEFVALGVELSQLLLGPVALLQPPGQHVFDVLPDELADLLAVLVGQRDGAPVLLHEFLDEVNRCRPERAAVLQALPAQAVEVVVVLAQPVAGDLETERLAALTAVDRALQVMGPYPWLLAALVSGLPDVLDPLV